MANMVIDRVERIVSEHELLALVRRGVIAGLIPGNRSQLEGRRTWSDVEGLIERRRRRTCTARQAAGRTAATRRLSLTTVH